MARPVFRSWPALCIVVLATLAAGCGSSDDEADADSAVTEGDSAAVDGADTGSDSAPQPTDAPETTTSEPAELTASFRGVSETTIKVGVIGPDLEALQGLVDLDHGSYEAAYRALIEDVNARGGINGRRIEMVYEDYLPIGTAELDEICARFTADEEVFAVLGGILDDGPLCYTSLSDTAVVGSTQNNTRIEASTAPWFTGTRNTDDAIEVVLRGFDREGFFEGESVAVVAAIADRNQVETTALPLLEELGVDVVDVAFMEASALDTAATDAEAQLIAEKQETEGATMALAVGGGTPQYVGGLEDLSFRPRIATTSLSSLRAYVRDRGGRDLTLLEDAVAGNVAEQLGWWADPVIQDCIALVESAGEPTIIDPNDRAEGEPENIVSVASACRNVQLFEAIAAAAGAELTNDSFAAAGAGLGDFHIPGFGPGFYDAETPDGAAPILLYRWDPAAVDLVTDGTTLS